MKKTGSLFSLLIIATLLLNIIPVHAAIDTSNSQDPLGIGINPDAIPQNPDDLKNVSTTYLKQEWTKILEKTGAGRMLLKVSDLLTSLNFFWKPVLGIEYSLSWLFVFAVSIWLVIFYLVYGAFTSLSENKLLKILLGFVITSLIGYSGAIKTAVDSMGKIIINKWVALIIFIIAILIIVLASKLAPILEERKRKIEEETDRGILKKGAKIAGAEIEAFKESQGK